MTAVRIKFSFKDSENERPDLDLSDAERFWTDVSRHTEPWLKFYVSTKPPENTVSYAEWKLRTVFAPLLSERLREFLVKSGAGPEAGTVI